MGRRFDPDRAHVRNNVYQERKTPPEGNFSVIVLCHKRISHLGKVLESLDACEGIEHAKLVFVAHESPQQVFDLIESFKYREKVILKVEDIHFSTPKQAINHNLFLGLKYGFDFNESEFCIVIEDDVVLAPDTIHFMNSCLSKFGNQKRFRGINSFSLNSPEDSDKGDVVKINYGLGWGWCLNRRNYLNLLKFWTGSEENHWDYFIEPYVRTGFLVSPIYSRSRNIGFDESGTHTLSMNSLGEIMDKSFKVALEKPKSEIKEVSISYINSRHDLVVLSNIGVFQRGIVYLLRDFSFKLYRLGIRGKPRIHYLWRQLRNFIDKRFSNVEVCAEV